MIVAAVAFAIQIAPIPPALPQDPGPERRAAAEALFKREWYASSENSWGIDIAASKFASDVLTERNAQAYDRDFRLSDRFIARVKADPEPVMDAAIKCMAYPLAERLSVPALEALKTFISTYEGRFFWMYHMQLEPWQHCFDAPVREYLGPSVDADLAAVVAETPIR